jgi:hypothetical protein
MHETYLSKVIKLEIISDRQQHSMTASELEEGKTGMACGRDTHKTKGGGKRKEFGLSSYSIQLL